MSGQNDNQKILVDQATIMEKLNNIEDNQKKQAQDFSDFQKEIRENYATKQDLEFEQRTLKDDERIMMKEYKDEISKITEIIGYIKESHLNVKKAVKTLMDDRLVKQNSMGAKVGSEVVKNIVKYVGIALAALILGGMAIAYQGAQKEMETLQRNLNVDNSQIQTLETDVKADGN